MFGQSKKPQYSKLYTVAASPKENNEKNITELLARGRHIGQPTVLLTGRSFTVKRRMETVDRQKKENLKKDVRKSVKCIDSDEESMKIAKNNDKIKNSLEDVDYDNASDDTEYSEVLSIRGVHLDDLSGKTFVAMDSERLVNKDVMEYKRSSTFVPRSDHRLPVVQHMKERGGGSVQMERMKEQGGASMQKDSLKIALPKIE